MRRRFTYLLPPKASASAGCLGRSKGCAGTLAGTAPGRPDGGHSSMCSRVGEAVRGDRPFSSSQTPRQAVVSARILTSIVESREDLPSPLVKSVASTIISDRKPLLLGDPLQMDTQGVAEAAEERFDH